MPSPTPLADYIGQLTGRRTAAIVRARKYRATKRYTDASFEEGCQSALYEVIRELKEIYAAPHKPAPPANLEQLRHRVTKARDRAESFRYAGRPDLYADGVVDAYRHVLNLIDQHAPATMLDGTELAAWKNRAHEQAKVINDKERRYKQQSRILRERNDEIGTLKLSLRRTTTSRNAALEAMGTKDTVIYDKDREIARLKKCQLNQRDTINLLRDQIAGTQNVLRSSCAAAEETLRKVGVPADQAITSLMEAD